MTTQRKTLTLAFIALAGSLLAFATLPLTGRAAAIAWPAAFAGWVRASGAPELGLLLWSVAVVGLLGVGIAFGLVGLAVLKFSASSRALTLALLLIGFLAGRHVPVPASFGHYEFFSSAVLERAWWDYGMEIALVLSAAAAAHLHSHFGRRQTTGQGSADHRRA